MDPSILLSVKRLVDPRRRSSVSRLRALVRGSSTPSAAFIRISSCDASLDCILLLSASGLPLKRLADLLECVHVNEALLYDCLAAAVTREFDTQPDFVSTTSY